MGHYDPKISNKLVCQIPLYSISCKLNTLTIKIAFIKRNGQKESKFITEIKFKKNLMF